MSLPEWLSKDIIENALRKYLQNNCVCVVGMMSKHAVPVGDNFCSEMFRVSVKYTTTKNGNVETISIIVKCRPESGIGESITAETPIFEKEIEMYTVTQKKMEKLLGEKCLSAQCLDSVCGKHTFLILEDLSPLGYIMADRKKGLDIDHCILVMKNIAKMHASSAVLYEKEPNSMDNYNSGIFTNKSDSKIMEHFSNAAYQSLLKALEKWPGYEKYIDKISKKVQNNIFVEACKSADRKPGFNVLNHGDLWVNNMLFKYDNKGKPVDVKFVDFQFSVFVSPAIDLQYFIHTSVSDDVGVKCVKQLLELYHQELVKKFAKMNYPKDKIPTFDQLCKDYKDRSLMGFSAASTVLPIAKAPARADANLEEIFKSNDADDGFRQSSYNEPEYKSRMQYLLKHFDEIGVFN